MRATFPLLAALFFLASLSAQDTQPTAPPTAQPVEKPTPGMGQQADVKIGDGESLAPDGVFQVLLMAWKDKFDGTPLGNPKGVPLMDGMDTNLFPGIARVVDGMKVGGVRRAVRHSDNFFGKKPRELHLVPEDVDLYVEVTLQKVWPNDPLELAVITEGQGDRQATTGDIVHLRFKGWQDAFDSAKVFDSSEQHDNNYGFKLGSGRVIEGMERGALGMKIGEVRRLSIPAYLGYGSLPHQAIPPYSRLYIELELLGFIEEGKLQVETTKPGNEQAPPVTSGNALRMHYTGWTDKFDGEKKFDSSRDKNQPITFILGTGKVIKGWDEGLVGMKPGEHRRLTVPWNLGYGDQPHGPKIPAFSTLYFDVELVDVIVSGKLESVTKKEGEGAPAESGTKVSVHYTGWLDKIDGEQKFDSSRDSGRSPFEFTIGQGQVIKGWDEGVLGMKPGEVRQLTIPWNFGYGANGAGNGKIPGFATLYFEIEYLGPK